MSDSKLLNRSKEYLHEEIWLQMLEARNKMSHTYDTDEALKVYASLASFLPELQKLCQLLKKEK